MSGDGVNDVRIIRCFVGCSNRIRKRLPDRRPALRRNRRAVEGSDHLLASGEDMSWRRGMHAKRRKEVAACIVVKSRRANLDGGVGRCRVLSAKDIMALPGEVLNGTLY